MTTAEDVSRVVGVAQEFVTVRWTCHAITERRRGIAVRACGQSVATRTPRTDYAARAATARCPECGGLLTQASDGCAEVVTQ